MKLFINKMWDGSKAPPREHGSLVLVQDSQHLTINVEAPFWGDPPPPQAPGPTMQLWTFEVVELFLLGADGRYLEVEMGPHGHYLALLFSSPRQLEQGALTMDYSAGIESSRWVGQAKISRRHLPKNLSRGNGYAIHGLQELRSYYAAYPVPGTQPDFHQPSYFGPLELGTVYPARRKRGYSLSPQERNSPLNEDHPVIAAIKDRRSIRDYCAGVVSREILETIVDCGRLAPSSNNRQSWEFIVVTKTTSLAQLAELATFGKFIREAQACIVVCGDPKNPSLVLDCAAATQNMLLAIHALGLASCWVQGYQKDYSPAIIRALNIPAHLELIAMLPVAHTSKKTRMPLKRPLCEVLHWEEY